MKIISSPAKLMKLNPHQSILTPTTPSFIKEAERIQSHLREKSPKFLSELMEISQKLADENWERNQKWSPAPDSEHSSSVLYTFTGEVYKGLDADSLAPQSVDYLQENYRILSGLYGLLRPSDRIMLYRLEMGRAFQFEGYKNLYDFWSERLTHHFNSELEEGEAILNLASAEYSKALNRKNLKGKWIDFEFYEMSSGKPKTIVVYTKHARGLMIRFCAQNQLKTLEEVKAFNDGGYLLDDERSTDSKLVFIR